MQNHAFLIFSQNCYPNSKIIFPLHEGENIIGTNKDSDICLQFQENDLDPIHAKITINKQKNLLDIGIKIIKSNKAYIKKEEIKKILFAGKEYELSKNCIFFLNDNIKFKLIKGTIDEIKTIFISENLENQFQKWYKKIISNEKENKTNLCIDKKYSYNLKNDKEDNKSLIDINNKNPSDNYKITKNELFSIIKPKKISYEDNIKMSSDKYLTESFSTSFSSNKKSNNLKICKKNLLNLFNKDIDEDEFENILQEKENIVRELLGENGLDDIIMGTNYKIIRKYDNLFYSIYNKKNNKINLNLKNKM